MNDSRLDARLVAAMRPNHHTNTFITTTMQKIRNLDGPEPSAWRSFLRATHAHKLAFGIVAAVVISTIAFSSYAYAIGSDPISLIKRWVVGDTVKIDYQDRHFEHGTGHSYSDAAVTAYAEVDTVTMLSFHAQNNLQIPKNGVEYVNLPPSMDPAHTYQNPYFATVTAVTADSVTIHKEYTWGNKMEASHDLDETITVPLADFHHFVAGEPAAAIADTLVMVFPDTSIRHDIAANNSTKVVTYFGFGLTHDLAAFKEASFTGQPVQTTAEQPLFEPSWGGLDKLCLNNGADECDINVFSKKDNDGLFPDNRSLRGMNNYNSDASWYFNVESGDKSDVISRNIMGQIVAIDDSSLTVRTSSGAQWHVGYTKANRDVFAKHYGELRIGDRVAGQILQSIYDLNSRSINPAAVASFERY